jgi:hypothetical protein
MKLRGLVPNFHLSLSDLYIPTIGPSFLLYRSQIHECRNWERGQGAVSFQNLSVSNFRYSVFAVCPPGFCSSFSSTKITYIASSLPRSVSLAPSLPGVVSFLFSAFLFTPQTIFLLLLLFLLLFLSILLFHAPCLLLFLFSFFLLRPYLYCFFSSLKCFPCVFSSWRSVFLSSTFPFPSQTISFLLLPFREVFPSFLLFLVQCLPCSFISFSSSNLVFIASSLPLIVFLVSFRQHAMSSLLLLFPFLLKPYVRCFFSSSNCFPRPSSSWFSVFLFSAFPFSPHAISLLLLLFF